MSKLIKLNKKEYENFVINHKSKSHFLQSYSWGEFSKEKKNLFPYYLGLVSDNGKIMAAALLLQKKLPFNLCYFYIPRGFVIDFNNKDLVKMMTEEIKKFCKEKKAIFFKIDPDIIHSQFNYLGQKVEVSSDQQKILQTLRSLGYKHLGFTKNFETSQPRYTFRIDLNQDLDTIIDHFSKTTKQRINKAKKLGIEVEIGTEEDLDTFYQLMMLTENRKDFVSFSKDYYKTQYQILKKDHMIVLFLGKVNTKEIIKNYEEELKKVQDALQNIDTETLSKSAKNKVKNLTSQKENLIKEINKFKLAKAKYGSTIPLSAHMIITYGNKAWVLYAGNHNILTETYTNYATYFEHIKYCKEQGIEIYDQFGTIGDLSSDNPRLGLHEFKKKFGGNYIEFLGEFDYILKPFLYFVFQKLVPFYRNIVKNKSKRELKNEIEGNK
ncbi:MAG: aminoacyltransferase [Bacilli bacterium]|nr:aminoacyltransferase [Bacilli bacterium]